jgi:hypothetical protein
VLHTHVFYFKLDLQSTMGYLQSNALLPAIVWLSYKWRHLPRKTTPRYTRSSSRSCYSAMSTCCSILIESVPARKPAQTKCILNRGNAHQPIQNTSSRAQVGGVSHRPNSCRSINEDTLPKLALGQNVRRACYCSSGGTDFDTFQHSL